MFLEPHDRPLGQPEGLGDQVARFRFNLHHPIDANSARLEVDPIDAFPSTPR